MPFGKCCKPFGKPFGKVGKFGKLPWMYRYGKFGKWPYGVW